LRKWKWFFLLINNIAILKKEREPIIGYQKAHYAPTGELINDTPVINYFELGEVLCKTFLLVFLNLVYSLKFFELSNPRIQHNNKYKIS
jgi:hypothetical protein